MKGEFRITYSKGFHVRFENGVVVSVQFGGGNYCDNHDGEIGRENMKPTLASSTAEMAVWRTDAAGRRKGEFITSSYPGNDEWDDVMGYKTTEQMLAVLNWAAALPVEVDE
jgi:hypothetical protein